MGTCPDPIKRLIERFDQQSDQVRSPDYNETQLRIDFVNPLFAALGWDIDNRLGNAEQYREVVHEDKVKVAGQAMVNAARTTRKLVQAYSHLQQHVLNYSKIPIIAFDEAAASTAAMLHKSKLRLGTMDIGIASIALAASLPSE